MLDLIIPVYKNKKGLYRSLMSLGSDLNKQVRVTVVDDCSGDNYDDVINIFQKFFPIRVIYLPQNVGPGMARQAGLNKATQPYVAFLDCGDIYTSPDKLLECLQVVKDNPECYMYSWGHFEEKAVEDSDAFMYTPIGGSHNRMHGKIYNRDFLYKYHITFCEESPRANEDIGFNISARLTAESLSRLDSTGHIYQTDDIAVVWKNSGPSIVRAENCAFYYRDQNTGMAINGEHILKICERNNVPDDLVLREIYEEMVHMYLFYQSTKNVRPEFLESQKAGALRYYINCFRDRGEENIKLLTDIFWGITASFMSDPDDPVRQTLAPLDFPGFLNELEVEYQISLNPKAEIADKESVSENTEFKYSELN